MSQQLGSFYLDQKHLEITFNQEFSPRSQVVYGLDDLGSAEYQILANIDNLLNKLKSHGFIANKLGPALNTTSSNLNVYDSNIKHFPTVYHEADDDFEEDPNICPIDYLEVQIHGSHCVITFAEDTDLKYREKLAGILKSELGLKYASSKIVTPAQPTESPKSRFK